MSKSRSDIKRLIKSKGIRINEEIYNSSDLSLKIYANKHEIKISVGKKNIGILKIKNNYLFINVMIFLRKLSISPSKIAFTSDDS